MTARARGRELTRRVQGATAGSVATGLAGQAALLVSGPLTARLLGVQDRGSLAFAVVVASITAQLASMGLPTAVTFLLASQGLTARSALSKFTLPWVGLTLAAATICAAALTVQSALYDAARTAVDVGLAALLVPAIMTQALLMACLQGEQRFRALNRLRAAPALLNASAVLVLALVRPSTSVTSILLLLLCSFAVSDVVAAAVVRRSEAPKARQDEGVSLRALSRYGRAAWISSATPLDGLSLDQAVVGLALGRRELGLYVVAVAFSNLSSLVLASVGLIASPRLSRAAAPERREIVRRVLLIASAAGVAVTLVVQASLDPVFRLAFGSAFADAVPVARILVVAGLFLALRRLLAQLLQGLGAPGTATAGELLGLAVLLVGLAALVPAFGLVGAALAVTVAGATSCAYLYRETSRRIALPPPVAY